MSKKACLNLNECQGAPENLRNCLIFDYLPFSLMLLLVNWLLENHWGTVAHLCVFMSFEFTIITISQQ